jgi:pimeloyl-ACP methyl ester carboxylesterase
MSAFLDNPLFLSVAFHPRKGIINCSTVDSAKDGHIDVKSSPGIKLGYRFFPLEDGRADPAKHPVFVCFHGNAEMCEDFDMSAPRFWKLGVSLLVIDFRGYGWSTGSPLLTKLLSDVESVPEALPSILGPGYRDAPLILMGRSIGSSCAVHLSSKFPNVFKGLVLESGLTVITKLPMVQQMSMMLPGGAGLVNSIPDIFEQCKKLRTLAMPVLVLHGEEDEIVPVSQGQDMYNAATSSRNRRIRRFPNAGHNDLVHMYGHEHAQCLAHFIKVALDPTMKGSEGGDGGKREGQSSFALKGAKLFEKGHWQVGTTPGSPSSLHSHSPPLLLSPLPPPLLPPPSPPPLTPHYSWPSHCSRVHCR